MRKCFIFRDYENNIFYPLHVSIDRNAGKILVNTDDIENILCLSDEDMRKLAADYNGRTGIDALLRLLKSKPELQRHPFKDWFELQILPRIIDEFNSFTIIDAAEEIRGY